LYLLLMKKSDLLGRTSTNNYTELNKYNQQQIDEQ
jgi:hypothetical protein